MARVISARSTSRAAKSGPALHHAWAFLVTMHATAIDGAPVPRREAFARREDAFAHVREHMTRAYCETRTLTAFYRHLDEMLTADAPIADVMRHWNREAARHAAGAAGAARIAAITVDAVRYWSPRPAQ